MDDLFRFLTTYPWFSGAVAITLASFLITIVQWSSAQWKMRSVDIGAPMSDEQKRRLWEHALHEDEQYNDRLNFFLIFESVLLGVMGAVFTRADASRPVLIAIALLGVIITLVWINIQAFHHFYVNSFNPRLETFEEFQKTLEYSRLWWPDWGRQLLSFGVPIAVTGIWIVVLALVEGVTLLS